jgi:hypothetical protein
MSIDRTETLLRDTLADRAGLPPAAPDDGTTLRLRGTEIRWRRRTFVGAGAVIAAALAAAAFSGVLGDDQARVEVGTTPSISVTAPDEDDRSPAPPPGSVDGRGGETAPPTGPTSDEDAGAPPESSDPSTSEPSAPAGSPSSAPSGTSGTTPTTSTTSTQPPAARPIACGDIAFSPNSDDMATNIVATGVSCAEATDLVRTVRGQHNFVDGPRAFTAAGWACTVSTDTASPVPVGHYRCSRGDSSVSWDKT